MVYNTQDYDIFIGIDVDQKSFSFTVKDHGQMKQQISNKATKDRFLLIPCLS